MINLYSQKDFKPISYQDHFPEETIWVDLLNPTIEEEHFAEKELGIEIPTRLEMQEIEVSSRLYKENDGMYMTATMLAKSDSSEPISEPVTIILTANKLVTLRYIEPHSFALFINRVSKLVTTNINAVTLFIELADASVDRLADILENISHRLEDYSQVIFRAKMSAQQPQPDFKRHLRDLGANGDLGTKAQESLITFNRLVTYFEQNASFVLSDENKTRLITLRRDISSLSDFATFLSTKVNFLLDATLGMINIEQNDIIKIFSIVAVILLPPTLVSSIYGMNFGHMPELHWQYGYPIALALMLISALIPYYYFKKKKWL